MRSISSAITVARLLVLTLSIFCLSTGAGFGADDVPVRGWPVSSPEAQGMDSEKLNDMLTETLGKKYHLDPLLRGCQIEVWATMMICYLG